MNNLCFPDWFNAVAKHAIWPFPSAVMSDERPAGCRAVFLLPCQDRTLESAMEVAACRLKRTWSRLQQQDKPEALYRARVRVAQNRNNEK
jgi:hypothetical protein